MKNQTLILFISLMGLLSACFYPKYEPINTNADPVFVSEKYRFIPSFKSFNDTGKFYYFINVWGFLKYHANISKQVDCDSVFITNYKDVKNADYAKFQQVVGEILDYNSILEAKQNKNDINDYALIDNRWFYDNLYFLIKG